MLKLGWLLGCVLAISVNAQDVVVNPPLSIEPEAGQRLKEPVEGALVPVNAEITVDGQLKLQDKKPDEKPADAKPADVKAEEKKPEPAAEAVAIAINPADTTPVTEAPRPVFQAEKYLQFSYGYLDSKWDKIDPSLENGSTLTSFRVVADMNRHNQFGFAIELVSDTTSEASPENIRAVQYRLFLDFHRTLFTDKLDYLFGAALTIGDYSIRKLELNGSGQEVYSKIKSGTIYGVIPSAGLRFYLVGKNSIDVTVEYHQYLSKPQKHIGGLALVPRFSFVF